MFHAPCTAPHTSCRTKTLNMRVMLKSYSITTRSSGNMGFFDHHINVPTQARSVFVPRRKTPLCRSHLAGHVIPCDLFRPSPPSADHYCCSCSSDRAPLPRHQIPIKFMSPLTSSNDPKFPVPRRTLPPSFVPVSPARSTLLEHNLRQRGCALLATHPPTPRTRVEDRKYMCM